jgi:hypothetical protein
MVMVFVLKKDKAFDFAKENCNVCIAWVRPKNKTPA